MREYLDKNQTAQKDNLATHKKLWADKRGGKPEQAIKRGKKHKAQMGFQWSTFSMGIYKGFLDSIIEPFRQRFLDAIQNKACIIVISRKLNA